MLCEFEFSELTERGSAALFVAVAGVCASNRDVSFSSLRFPREALVFASEFAPRSLFIAVAEVGSLLSDR